MVFIVRFEDSNDIAKAEVDELTEARDIIDKEVPTYIAGNIGTKTLAKRKDVRLDLQGQFNRPDKKRYANLQIQLNKPRCSEFEEESEHARDNEDVVEGAKAESEEQPNIEDEEDSIANFDKKKKKSTTIALVLMPSNEEIPKNIAQQAFYGSLNNRRKAIIEKQ